MRFFHRTMTTKQYQLCHAALVLFALAIALVVFLIRGVNAPPGYSYGEEVHVFLLTLTIALIVLEMLFLGVLRISDQTDMPLDPRDQGNCETGVESGHTVVLPDPEDIPVPAVPPPSKDE